MVIRRGRQEAGVLLRTVWGLRLCALLLAGGLAGGCATRGTNGPSMRVRTALRRVSPAVVRIDVVMREFNGGVPVSFRAIGSGVIIDPQGHVLTNFHVAGRAKHIRVTLYDQEHVRAKLVGSDHWTDLALVQLNMREVHRKHLTFAWAKLGNSAHVQLGQPVLAIGTPYGLSRTVTRGIISNTDRYFSASTIDGYETGQFNNWLQTDAAINPGNSGGPLVNLRGRVIGINTRGDPTGNNLGFAIPINVARQVIPQLLQRKKVARSYIGIHLESLQDLQHYYDLKHEEGVLISSVDPESPALAAGLQPQDILLAVNGHRVNARFPEQLAAVAKLIASQPLKSRVALYIQRPGGDGHPVRLTKYVRTQRLQSVVTQQHSIAGWGIVVRNLTKAYLRSLRLPLVKGVLVTSTRDGSRIQRAGLQDGDIIMRVNRTQVLSYKQLRKIAARLDRLGHSVVLLIRRGRNEKTLVFRPRKTSH